MRSLILYKNILFPTLEIAMYVWTVTWLILYISSIDKFVRVLD